MIGGDPSAIAERAADLIRRTSGICVSLACVRLLFPLRPLGTIWQANAVAHGSNSAPATSSFCTRSAFHVPGLTP
jgi:hypothetical protein